MENNSESWFHQQCLQMLSPNLRLLDRTFDMDQLNNEPVCRNPYSVDNSTLRIGPSFPLPEVQPLKTNEPNDVPNWFHAIPHYRQAFTASLNSAPKEKFPASLPDFIQQGGPKMGFGPVQKKFLVFDQSGDKTTLIYSSGVENSVKRETNWAPKLPKDGTRDSTYNLSPITKDEQRDDKSGYVSEDEMHEDTEELNALLYSDSYSSEDDEETTSTGHSPSTMTDNGIRDDVDETDDEVNSLVSPTKRRKLLDGAYVVPSNLKTRVSSASKDDAESSCGNGQNLENICSSLSGVKRSRKEKIRETVSILQSIIPNVREKSAIGVIDEAINYLMSLKVKAKALGIDTL